MAVQELKQSTVAEIIMGPFLDKTDGVTPETSISAPSTVRIWKNGVTSTVDFSTGRTPAWNHDGDGFYAIGTLATDVDTIGRLKIEITLAATHLPVWHDYKILSAVSTTGANSVTNIIGGSYTRSAQTSMYPRVNEGYTTPAFQLINPATGDVVDPDGVTLVVVIETKDASHTEIESIADGSLTKVGGAAGTVQFTTAQATNALLDPKLWSIRDTTSNIVYREGEWSVSYSAE